MYSRVSRLECRDCQTWFPNHATNIFARRRKIKTNKHYHFCSMEWNQRANHVQKEGKVKQRCQIKLKSHQKLSKLKIEVALPQIILKSQWNWWGVYTHNLELHSKVMHHKKINTAVWMGLAKTTLLIVEPNNELWSIISKTFFSKHTKHSLLRGKTNVMPLFVRCIAFCIII